MSEFPVKSVIEVSAFAILSNTGHEIPIPNIEVEKEGFNLLPWAIFANEQQAKDAIKASVKKGKKKGVKDIRKEWGLKIIPVRIQFDI